MTACHWKSCSTAFRRSGARVADHVDGRTSCTPTKPTITGDADAPASDVA